MSHDKKIQVKKWSELIAPLFILALGALLIIGSSRGVVAAERAPIPPPQDLKLMSFGYNETIADSLWLRTVQDFDLCEARDIKDGKRVPHAKPGEVRERIICKRGWVYQMIDTITELAPRFKAAHVYGATMLSVVVDDIEGANLIFEKAIKRFPTDWTIPYAAAYHAIYETKDEKKAADYLRLAGEEGAPAWVYALAAKIYTKEGQAVLAKSILEDALAKSPDPESAERIEQRLKEVEQSLQEAKPEAK